MESKIITTNDRLTLDKNHLSYLTLEEITMIDEALRAVGEFGEVRLVISRGRLHFLVAQKSFNARKYEPGMISQGLNAKP